jgi:hypothetical protein
MKTRMMRKIAVLVTGSALALSVPVAGAIAEPGGVPHPGSQGKANQHKNQGKQHKQNGLNGHVCSDNAVNHGEGTSKDITTLPGQAQTKGLKCGFLKAGLDGTDQEPVNDAD